MVRGGTLTLLIPTFCSSWTTCAQATVRLQLGLTLVDGAACGFPELALDKTAFFSEQDLFTLGSANEFVEVSIAPGDGTALFLDTLQIFEASNPGAVARVRIAHTYNGTTTKWR